MEKITKGDLKKKLEYLNLDLDNVPGDVIDHEPLNFNVSRLNNDKDHRVFKFVPIDKIEILITPTLRTDPLKEKYAKAMPLHKYMLPTENEEDLEKYTIFLKMLKDVSINEIENVASLQKGLEKKEPFKVKYNKDHLWQIYYSEATGKYFMLVCSKEKTFAEFFYLLKRKIEFANSRARIAPKIYVPINAMNYSEEFLNRNEIADLENYIWLFTKNWALTFEVYNRTNELSLQIVGETVVYDDVKSSYKVKLTSREEAVKFYKLLKALFIMQTEIKNHFNFTTKIDSNNSLEIYLGEKRLTYDMITEFIRSEFKIAEEEIRVQNDNITELEEELENIKFAVRAKEEEYQQKQREISTYLECKKTFIGKVKYFFKTAKTTKKSKDDQSKKVEVTEQETSKVINVEPMNESLKNKKYYTIEDLVTIYSLLEKGERNYKNLNQDLKALRLKLENIVSKVKNANLYIEEIDKHRKSIFDFWKFSNKDEKLGLEMGNENEKEENKNTLKKYFDYKTDLEDLGAKVDTIQRKKLSREEMDALFVAKTEVLYLLNMLRENDLNKRALENTLQELKEEFNNNRLYIDSETFDIFGNVDDDSRKVKYIGSRSHRENEKSKFKILNINKKIDVFDFTEKLQSIIGFLEGAIPKSKAEYDFSLYKVSQITEKVKTKSFDVYNLNVEKALEEYDDDGEGALNLIKLNFKEGLPLLYYSNIIFYDNNNQTLPIGMDVSSSVFMDCKKFSFKLVKKNKFRTNNYFTESNNLILPKSKDVFVYEYDVDLKENDDEDEEEEDDK
ncbi:MAG: hypothetical protein IKL55_01635 [Clostridia bacterium]|nr:hypothetical protein [Clostridia bacterium]